MSYKFGQFRRTNKNSYSRSLQYDLIDIKTKSPISEGVVFQDKAINLTGNNVLNFVHEDGIRKRNYYLRFRVYKLWGQTENETQQITIKLVNPLKTTDNEQKFETVVVPRGIEDDYSVFDLVIPPNAVYSQIHFILNRILPDYNTVDENNIYGRKMTIEIERLEEIDNVIDTLNSVIENKGQLKQIGVQGPPGLQMCIDGESIRIGRSGLYEINNGIFVNFIGFIVEPDDNKYFILDYQY